MKEHAFCSGSACKKLLRTVSFLGWKLHGLWSNEQNISGGLRQCQEGSLRSPGCNTTSIYSFTCSAAFYKPGTVSCCCLADSSHSREPDSKDERLLTQVSSRVARFTETGFLPSPPSPECFCSSFLCLWSFGAKKAEQKSQQKEPDSPAPKGPTAEGAEYKMYTELAMSSRGMENKYSLGLPKGMEWEGMLLPGLHLKQPIVVRTA